MRDIRTMYNLAIKYGYAKQLEYPFNAYKIAKFKSNTRKIALTKEEFEKFKNFDISLNREYETAYKMFFLAIMLAE